MNKISWCTPYLSSLFILISDIYAASVLPPTKCFEGLIFEVLILFYKKSQDYLQTMGKSKISKEAKSTNSLLQKKLSLKKKKKFKDVNSIASPTAVVPAQKGVKRKRIMGPCPDIQLRMVEDNFIPDFGDENDGGDNIVEEEMDIENDVDVEAVQDEEKEMHIENDADVEAVKRRVMQEVRENHNTPHTISRKGYARLEEELKKKRNIPKEELIDKVELWKIAHKQRKGKKPNVGVQQALEKLKKLEEENVQSGSSSKDLLSKAFGEERPGRVRGKGYGVTRTKLSLQSKIQEQCNKTIKELIVGVLSNKVEMLEQKDSTTKVGSPSIRVGTPNLGVASNNNLVSPSGGSPSPGGGSPNCSPNVVKVPKNCQACKILSWYNEGEVVADGTIHEVNPLKKVHGMPIGIGAYSVFVNFALEPDALLYKPWSDFRCVKDVIGTTVAWHKDFISF